MQRGCAVNRVCHSIRHIFGYTIRLEIISRINNTCPELPLTTTSDRITSSLTKLTLPTIDGAEHR
jgi:hypothetical protein